MRRTVSLFAILLALYTLAGCSRNQTPPPASGPASTSGTKSTSPPTNGRQMPAQAVDVQLGEWFVKLSPSPTKPGMTHFAIRNAGKRVHAFAIKGQGIEQESQRIDPGKSAMLMVDLKPGKYQTWCPVGNHASQGMRADFEVK